MAHAHEALQGIQGGAGKRSDVAAHAYKRKFTKTEVDYESPAKGEHNCGGCEHFEVLGPQRCEIVSGKILEGDWCRKWEKK